MCLAIQRKTTIVTQKITECFFMYNLNELCKQNKQLFQHFIIMDIFNYHLCHLLGRHNELIYFK